MHDEDTCDMCCGLKGHNRLKNYYCEIFKKEYNDAQEESKRLQNLFMDVCWYNFETRCKTWTNPWPQSVLKSMITLYGCSFRKVNNLRGERCDFPIWYSGKVSNAPHLPPQIIFNELQDSKHYLQFCKDQCNAPFDFAPGGKEYLKILASTHVPTDLARKRKRSETSALSISRRIASNDNDGGECT